MDTQIITFILSISLLIYIVVNTSQKNKMEENIDNIINSSDDIVIKDTPPSEKELPITTHVGNVLSKKTDKNSVYIARNINREIRESDSSMGNFNYKHVQGSIKKNAIWGKSGPDEKDLERESDVQHGYLYGLKKGSAIKKFDKHYSVDGHQPIEDVSSATFKEKYRYMNTALGQLKNAQSNSYKNNINIDSFDNKQILVHSKSKIIAPSFVAGYLTSKEAISLHSGIPVNPDKPIDISKTIETKSDEINFNNDNKLIYKIF